MRVPSILSETQVAPARRAHGSWQRPAALVLSCLIHVAVIGCLILVDPPSLTRKFSPTVYDQLIAPSEKKLVWYRVKELPRIEPVEKIGDSPTPQGAEKRKDVIISVDPDAESAHQLVLRKDIDKPLVKETPAPNLVAVQAPTPQPVARKAFQPPPAKSSPERSAMLAAPPEAAASRRAPAGNALDLLIKPLPKMTRKFVPPPVRTEKPAMATLRTDVPELTAPLTETGPGAGSLVTADSTLAKSVTRLPGRPFVPPSLGKAATGRPSMVIPEPDSGPGGAVSAAVLSTSPLNDLLAPLPDGFRRASISAAPTVGRASSGSGGHSGPQAPGLVLQPGNLAALPLATDLGPALYEETRASSLRATLSAPLRPSSRTIPRVIEARFHGRTVYTMILAPPRLPMYASDWTVWFAERGDAGGAGLQMRAPLPIRKFGLAADHSNLKPLGHIQLSAIILKTGRVDSVELLDKSSPDSKQAAVADFQHWQFAPAVRDGLPVDVDIIIEIPYQ